MPRLLTIGANYLLEHQIVKAIEGAKPLYVNLFEKVSCSCILDQLQRSEAKLPGLSYSSLVVR